MTDEERHASERRHTSERVGALERDVLHIADRMDSLAKDMSDQFEALGRTIAGARQPITAFAGWAAVLITIGGVVMVPVFAWINRVEATALDEHHKTDAKIEKIVDILTQERIDAARRAARLTTIERAIFQPAPPLLERRT